MLNVHEFVHKLSEVAVGSVAIRCFEEWFVQNSWNVMDWAPPVLCDAVYSLEIVLAEYSNQHVDASYVREFSACLAHELEDASQSIRPTLIGQDVTTAEIIRARVAAKPMLAVA
jgi:hypothetical protein